MSFAATKADTSATNSSAMDKPIVLIVDDEESILNALKRSLGRVGVEIITASTAADALYILENTDVNLIISDMRMPDMDGAELLSNVAKDSPDTIRFLLSGHSDMESTIRAINEGHIHQYLTKPWDDVELRTLIETTLHSHLLEVNNRKLSEQLIIKNKQLEDLTSSLEKKVDARTEELRLNARLIEHAFSDLQKSYGHVLRLASSLTGLRDVSTVPVGNKRAAMAQLLAEATGLGRQDVQHISDAALLADLGNIGIPDVLLNKPFIQFDGNDMNQYSQAPVLAETTLLGIPGMKNSALILRHQFERFDGSGYPDHLAGDNIPVGARVLSIVRDYTDLLRGRFTGETMTPAAAQVELINQSGLRYDPTLIDIFCENCGAFDIEGLAENEQCIEVSELLPGMVLSRDLHSERGMILLTCGHVLNSELISRLCHLETWSSRPLDIRIEKTPQKLAQQESNR